MFLKLEYLDLSGNELKGGVPKSLQNATILHSLDLSNNSLSENLTVIIHHLSRYARYSLQTLNLGMNLISGTLPNTLSMLPSLKGLYLYRNKLNGTIPEDVQFPTGLEVLDLRSNSLKGVIIDSHFANMSRLNLLDLSYNSLALEFSQNWVPSFQLGSIGLRYCKLGPTFPKWLQTQNNFERLDISNAEIRDIVPKWFWTKIMLKDFFEVDVSYNNLQGTIPNFPPPKNIAYSLILGSNQFEGSIPLFLRGSIFLDLSNNKFSDSHPFLCASGAADNLYKLDLSNNELSGQIPDCWSHFKSLAYLNLSHNKFSGKIPTSMGSLFNLQALILRSNDLTYEIPFTLKNCTKLVMLDMAENRLSGPIPTWIGSTLQELEILSLGRNHFCGILPLEICNLKSIHLLDLSLNNLSGQIPKCIKKFSSMAQRTSSKDYEGHAFFVNTTNLGGNFSYELNALLMWKGSEQIFTNNGLLLLKSIDLSSNHFSDEIPIEIENLYGLISLNLSRNHLIGKIPSNIGMLTLLEFLDLSRNQLVGPIPLSLAQIHRLSMLDLSHNNLSGKIPTGTQLQGFNASCYEDNLDLCGPPLKLCNGGDPTEQSNKFREHDYLIFTHEFYMSMAIGFVLCFLGVFWLNLNKAFFMTCLFQVVK
ncbi:hypothetical protein VNO78_32929 [Psophocarpus tetragonolobus]|uniref:Uncharacterized protein n=1 Tax=Psophocarpus tetragonolobus TaxID=3891 RepID=A0AAN9RPS3_PSOTE